jgi:hypothetical protein
LPGSAVTGQSISSSLPNTILKSEKYLFYLHGGAVTVLGNNAITQSMPQWGPYEYLNILDSLRRRGFNIISENRKQGIEDSVYTDKIVRQADTLFKAGVKPQDILIVGASAGSAIAISVSAKLKNNEMKYVIMGACWPDTYKEYLDIELYDIFFRSLNRVIRMALVRRYLKEENRLKTVRKLCFIRA